MMPPLLLRFLVPVIVAGLAAGCSLERPPWFYRTAEERDGALRTLSQTRSFSLGRPSRIRLTPDGAAVLYLRSAARERTQSLYEFDVATSRERVLASAETLLGGASDTVSAEEQARRERQRITLLGITSYELSEDGRLVLASVAGRSFVVERAGGGVKEIAGLNDALDARFSPDGNRIAFVRAYDLHVLDWRTGQEQRLTTGGGEDTPHGLAEFVAQEEMDRDHGYWWSPDSTQLAYQATDQREVESVFIPDPAHPAKPPQAWRYPRAGRANATVRLAVVSASGGPPTWLTWDAAKYPYLAQVTWERRSPLTVLVQSRDQKEESLRRVDVQTGQSSELLREKDEAWINLDASMPWWLESGDGFLWISEADGERRLWLHRADGTRVRALNDDSFRLRDVLSVDEEGGIVFVSGASDPTEKHVYALSLDRLHCKPFLFSFDQESVSFSKNHAAAVLTGSGLTTPAVQQVFRMGAPATLTPLPSAAEAPPYWPNVEVTKVGPNDEFDAAIVRPRNFAAGRKYPVIVYVYGGPGPGVVHKEARHYYVQQWYADQGFIVVSSDNRGVAHRGRAWERAIYGDFATIPLDDQAAALKALGAKYGELDLSRVGIMGWSFGGYMAALGPMRRGDVFHAGVAGAPVVDWEDYDTHYTERYLNTPQANPDGYRRSSLLTYAGELKRPLLIIHGTADDNVYFVNSLKLTDALFRAGKPFEFIPLSGYTHLVPDADMKLRVERRTAEFFRRELIERRPS